MFASRTSVGRRQQRPGRLPHRYGANPSLDLSAPPAQQQAHGLFALACSAVPTSSLRRRRDTHRHSTTFFLTDRPGAVGLMLAPNRFWNPFVAKRSRTSASAIWCSSTVDGGHDGLTRSFPTTTWVACAPSTPHRDSGNGGLQLTPASLGVPSGAACRPSSTTTPAQLVSSRLIGLHYSTLRQGALVQGCGYPDYRLSQEMRPPLETGQSDVTHVAARACRPASSSPPLRREPVPVSWRWLDRPAIRQADQRAHHEPRAHLRLPVRRFRRERRGGQARRVRRCLRRRGGEPAGEGGVARHGGHRDATVERELSAPLQRVHGCAAILVQRLHGARFHHRPTFREMRRSSTGAQNQPGVPARLLQGRQGVYDSFRPGSGHRGRAPYDLFREVGDQAPASTAHGGIGIANDCVRGGWPSPAAVSAEHNAPTRLAGPCSDRRLGERAASTAIPDIDPDSPTTREHSYSQGGAIPPAPTSGTSSAPS